MAVEMYRYVARKIRRNKWESPEGWLQAEAPADAITGGCLKTASNTLSLWQFADPLQDLEEVGLALAANLDHLDAFHICWIEYEQLASFKLELTDGQTPVNDLRNRHLDLCFLGGRALADFADRLFAAVRTAQCRIFREKELIVLLTEAIAKGRLSRGALKPDVAKKLGLV